mmetsp:Transcript_19969/g.50688  ORF Transcript_19969/g.50688 Transcript_19969/m.50688 type:complete len:218 (-) Transcript_19969:478-1131(-)
MSNHWQPCSARTTDQNLKWGRQTHQQTLRVLAKWHAMHAAVLAALCCPCHTSHTLPCNTELGPLVRAHAYKPQTTTPAPHPSQVSSRTTCPAGMPSQVHCKKHSSSAGGQQPMHPCMQTLSVMPYQQHRKAPIATLLLLLVKGRHQQHCAAASGMQHKGPITTLHSTRCHAATLVQLQPTCTVSVHRQHGFCAPLILRQQSDKLLVTTTGLRACTYM